MKVEERLLNYVKVNTMSNEECMECPSTKKQLELGKMLVEELKGIGVNKVEMDEHGYVYASLNASIGAEKEKKIGLIAHMDTAPAFSGENIHPRIIENYDGKDIVLNKSLNIVMSPVEFESLTKYQGQTLIVTDGTTLLGGDDKAGIAEIITAMEYIIENKIPHGEIKIAFTPDEEIGRGADLFNVEKFGADYAYTVDGGEIGELEYENFNAASAKIYIHGVNIHPGDAKNKMKNACLLAMEFNKMLPSVETPAHTEHYEGFYHLCDMKGDESEAELNYIIRDHSMEKFNDRKNFIGKIAGFLNEKYGEGTIETVIEDSYYNMKEKILPHMDIVDKAKIAMEKCDIEWKVVPIRGGTDGARLSYMGLPCPNLSTGGHNFHGKYEYISVESMEKMVKVLANMSSL